MTRSSGSRWNKRIAEDLKQIALRQVAGKHFEWIETVLPLVADCARDYKSFTSDEVFKRIVAAKIEMPDEPRAMGAVMRLARSAGWIEPADMFVVSDRVSNHRRPMRVWKSRLYRNAQVY